MLSQVNALFAKEWTMWSRSYASPCQLVGTKANRYFDPLHKGYFIRIVGRRNARLFRQLFIDFHWQSLIMKSRCVGKKLMSFLHSHPIHLINWREYAFESGEMVCMCLCLHRAFSFLLLIFKLINSKTWQTKIHVLFLCFDEANAMACW